MGTEIQTDNFRDIDRPKKKRKKKNYLLRALIVIAILVGAFLLVSSSLFDVGSITVENNDYYTDEEVITIANAKKGVNIFWGIDGSDIKKRLLDNPYFEEVNIKRKFPNTLIIDVTERLQIAAIKYGDEYIVIDESGTVLRKTDVNPKLTLLRGLTISKLTVGEKVDAEEAVALKNTLAMLSAMKDGDLFFKKIVISKAVIKAYIYDTLLCRGTPKQMLSAIKSGDLSKVINKLFQNDTTRGTVSLGDNNYASFSPAID